MRKQTVWLLIILLGAFSMFLAMAGGRGFSLRESLLAQVGVLVGVAPNPYNTLEAQLDQEKNQLDQQSSTLAAREAALQNDAAAAGSVTPAIWYLALAVALVALLVLMNFYFDWRRSRQTSEATPPVAPSDTPGPQE